MVNRMLCRKVGSDSLKISIRLLNSYVGLQSADGGPPSVSPRAFGPHRVIATHIRDEWRPNLRLAMRIPDPPVGNLSWHDRDDRVRLIVDTNRLAEDQMIAMKARLPEVVTDNRDEIVSPTILVIPENAAHQGLDA